MMENMEVDVIIKNMDIGVRVWHSLFDDVILELQHMTVIVDVNEEDGASTY